MVTYLFFCMVLISVFSMMSTEDLLLEKYDLTHILSTFRKHRFDDVSLWLDIDAQIWRNMNLLDSDRIRFKKLQLDLKQQKQTNVEKSLEVMSPIIVFCIQNMKWPILPGFIFPAIVWLYNKYHRYHKGSQQRIPSQTEAKSPTNPNSVNNLSLNLNANNSNADKNDSAAEESSSPNIPSSKSKLTNFFAPFQNNNEKDRISHRTALNNIPYRGLNTAKKNKFDNLSVSGSGIPHKINNNESTNNLPDCGKKLKIKMSLSDESLITLNSHRNDTQKTKTNIGVDSFPLKPKSAKKKAPKKQKKQKKKVSSDESSKSSAIKSRSRRNGPTLVLPVRRYSSPEMSLRKSTFKKVVLEILQKYPGFLIQESAITALQETTESHLIAIFEGALCGTEGGTKRGTILARDMRFEMRRRGILPNKISDKKQEILSSGGSVEILHSLVHESSSSGSSSSGSD